MNQLIKITEIEDGKQVVSATELHKFLEVVKHMTQWIKPYIDKDNDYGFIEGIDFMRIDGEVNPTNGIPTIDYVITLDMGKELSMLSKSAKGKQARKYFIECEKEIKQLKPTCIEDVLISSLQEMKALKGEVQAIKKSNEETKEEIQGIRDVVALTPNAWRKDTTTLINKIAMKLGGFEHIKDVREESYKLLNDTYKVDVKRRLSNKQKNMAFEGVSKYKINKLNPLDVIAEDEKLINGYINIISKMAIKYGAV